MDPAGAFLNENNFYCRDQSSYSFQVSRLYSLHRGKFLLPSQKSVDVQLYEESLHSLKETLVYKCVVEHTAGAFEDWLNAAMHKNSVTAFNLVGGASSSATYRGPTLQVILERISYNFK